MNKLGIAALLLFTAALSMAQVTIACSPQPLAATRSIAERSMGPYHCFVTNDGIVPFTLTPSKFFQAVMPLRPVGPVEANQIITDAVNRLPQSKFVKWGGIALTLAAAGYGIYSGNATVPLAVSVGVSNAPKIIEIVAGTVPSGAPFLLGQFTAAVTIAPAGEIPNGVLLYCMKTRNPGPFTTKIQ